MEPGAAAALQFGSAHERRRYILDFEAIVLCASCGSHDLWTLPLESEVPLGVEEHPLATHELVLIDDRVCMKKCREFRLC